MRETLPLSSVMNILRRLKAKCFLLISQLVKLESSDSSTHIKLGFSDKNFKNYPKEVAKLNPLMFQP